MDDVDATFGDCVNHHEADDAETTLSAHGADRVCNAELDVTDEVNYEECDETDDGYISNPSDDDDNTDNDDEAHDHHTRMDCDNKVVEDEEGDDVDVYVNHGVASEDVDEDVEEDVEEDITDEGSGLDDDVDDEGNDYSPEEISYRKWPFTEQHKLYWKKKRALFIYEGSHITVLQLALAVHKEMDNHESSTYGAIEGLLRIQSVSMPQPNHCPTTLAQLNSLLGTAKHTSILRGFCTKTEQCGMHPFLPRDKWPKSSTRFNERQFCCSVCNESQFEVRKGGAITLKNRVYYFGFENVVRDMLNNREFCELNNTSARDTDIKGNYWGDELFRDTNAVVMHKLGVDADLRKSENLVLQLGSDSISPKKDSKRVKVGAWAIRSLTLPSSERSKKKFCFPLFMFPGEHEVPSGHLKHAFSEFYVEAKKLIQVGIMVSPKGDTRKRSNEINVRALIGLFIGDTPVCTAVRGALGHNAICGCAYCFFQGERKKGAVRFAGYAKPAFQKYGEHKFSLRKQETCGNSKPIILGPSGDPVRSFYFV